MQDPLHDLLTLIPQALSQDAATHNSAIDLIYAENATLVHQWAHFRSKQEIRLGMQRWIRTFSSFTVSVDSLVFDRERDVVYAKVTEFLRPVWSGNPAWPTTPRALKWMLGDLHGMVGEGSSRSMIVPPPIVPATAAMPGGGLTAAAVQTNNDIELQILCVFYLGRSQDGTLAKVVQQRDYFLTDPALLLGFSLAQTMITWPLMKLVGLEEPTVSADEFAIPNIAAMALKRLVSLSAISIQKWFVNLGGKS